MQQSQVKHDLLAVRPLRSLWRSAAFPVVLQAISLGAVVALIAVGFGVGAGRSPAELLSLRKTNLTTLRPLGWAMLAAILVITWQACRWSRQVPVESAIAAKVGLASAAMLFTSVLATGSWCSEA